MKKGFHVFFLFVLFSLFAVNTAWSACPEYFQEDAVTGDCYVNLPTSGRLGIDVPTGLTSFKVYDDGGKDGIYSNDAEGRVLLYAPTGYVFQISGDIDIGDGASVSFVDQYEHAWQHYSCPSVCSERISYIVGSVLELKLKSGENNDSHAGFAFTVSVVEDLPYGIEIVEVSGGVVEAASTTAKLGSTVNLTITPDASNDYLFKGLKVVKKGTTEEVAVDAAGVDAANGGIATFTMPNSDVSITPSWGHFVTVTNFTSCGTVTTNKTVATEGEIVTLTITSNNGYLLNSLDVKDADENPVSVTLSDDITSATFEMPASNVSVEPRWVQLYDVEIANATGGTVTPDNETAAEGQTVTLTITPENRYALTSLKVTRKFFTNYSVNVVFSDDKATFTMPDYNVVITPTWDINVLTDDGDGGLYVNMPKTGTKTVTIPEDVKSFKVYDDGGKDENHDLHADGYLVLKAPEGYQLQVTGTACYSYANFFIYDGDSEAEKLFDEEYARDGIDVGTIRSSGNKLTIYFKSRNITQGTDLSGLDLTVSLVKVDFGAVSIAKADDGKIHATINGDYSGNETLVISEAIEVDAIDYNREIDVETPVTALLPVTLPAGTTVNADFYTLEKVEQVEGMKWQATMTYIGKNNLPQPNTPYAVILPKGQAKLEFDLKGNKATVQTGKIKKVCGLSDCKLDENEQITDDWFFTGTYAYKQWNTGDEELGLAYAFAASDNPDGAAKGKFGKIKAGAFANATRCYLRKRDAKVKLQQQNQAQMVAASPYVARYSINNLPETIDVEFVKNDEKGGRTVLRGRMNTVTGEFKMLRDYDLKGRKVNSTNRARGAYYGKKVLKK